MTEQNTLNYKMEDGEMTDRYEEVSSIQYKVLNKRGIHTDVLVHIVESDSKRGYRNVTLESSDSETVDEFRYPSRREKLAEVVLEKSEDEE